MDTEYPFSETIWKVSEKKKIVGDTLVSSWDVWALKRNVG